MGLSDDKHDRMEKLKESLNLLNTLMATLTQQPSTTKEKTMSNVIKIDFKALSKPTDKKAMKEYNKKYPLKKARTGRFAPESRPCNQLFVQSKNRFEQAIDRLNRCNDSFDYTYNVEYWKEHGKLPDNVDLSKVRGKGMYNANANNYRR